MKKGMQVSFGGGSDSILFSVRENKFYSYENDSVELHELYGGKMYYQSRSGLCGAGFLERSEDLVPFGYCRTDCSGPEQMRMTVHEVEGQSIFGYAPIISHHGIDCSAPFILTDGRKVAFVQPSEVRENLLHWQEVSGKEISLTWYGGWYKENEVTFVLHNPHRFTGVSATRFIDLRQARRVVDEEFEEYSLKSDTLFEQTLHIAGSSYHGVWYHTCLDGYFDRKWDTDPRHISGEEIVEGWFGTGDGLYYRRRRSGVQAFLEIPRKDISEGRYVLEGETPEYVDYEQNFSVLEWYSKTTEELRDFFVAKVIRKAREDYVYARTRAGIDTRALMEANPEREICLQDSYESGNCEVGTANFIGKYNLKVTDRGCITVGELLKNPGIEDMLRVFEFQKTINHKLIV